MIKETQKKKEFGKRYVTYKTYYLCLESQGGWREVGQRLVREK